MKALIIKLYRFFERFIKFSIVGVINTLIYLAVYYAMLAFGVNHIYSNIAGYFAGSVNGYLLSKFWVFKDAKTSGKESVLKFYVVYGSSLLLSTGLVYLLVNVLGVSDKIAPLLTICVTTPYNYFLQKIWTFRKVENDIEDELTEEKNRKNT